MNPDHKSFFIISANYYYFSNLDRNNNDIENIWNNNVWNVVGVDQTVVASLQPSLPTIVVVMNVWVAKVSSFHTNPPTKQMYVFFC
jgi:hypothetical protein